MSEALLRHLVTLGTETRDDVKRLLEKSGGHEARIAALEKDGGVSRFLEFLKDVPMVIHFIWVTVAFLIGLLGLAVTHGRMVDSNTNTQKGNAGVPLAGVRPNGVRPNGRH